MEKIYNMQEWIGNIKREMDILKKEQKRNASDKKYCDINKECLWRSK